MTSQEKKADSKKGITVSHVFGEIVWLLSQSKPHLDLTVQDMNWLVMPSIHRHQFQIFREGERPVGVALWALLDDAGERKITKGFRSPYTKLEDAEWSAGDRLWLIEFVAPFSTTDNRHAELMMADLVTGPLANRAFKFLRTDSAVGEMQVVSVPADAGATLVKGVKETLGTVVPCH